MSTTSSRVKSITWPLQLLCLHKYKQKCVNSHVLVFWISSCAVFEINCDIFLKIIHFLLLWQGLGLGLEKTSFRSYTAFLAFLLWQPALPTTNIFTNWCILFCIVIIVRWWDTHLTKWIPPKKYKIKIWYFLSYEHQSSQSFLASAINHIFKQQSHPESIPLIPLKHFSICKCYMWFYYISLLLKERGCCMMLNAA